MSVLVKGWSIPSNGCCGCSFRTGKYCGILDKYERVWEHVERYTRPSNCPLVDVPTPHGRLIDANALDHDLDEKWNILDDVDFANKAVWNTLKEATIVIEAEE